MYVLIQGGSKIMYSIQLHNMYIILIVPFFCFQGKMFKVCEIEVGQLITGFKHLSDFIVLLYMFL